MGEVQAVQRGCGTRKAGGIYAECGLSDDGLPLEAFLFDPPILIPEGLDLAPQGVMLMERNGITHLLDWVGANHYPNVADFVEEVRRFGLSRRLQGTIDFSKLGPGSKIMLVHARASMENPEAYRSHEYPGHHYCPHHPEPWLDHITMMNESICEGVSFCAGIWWEDIEGGEPESFNSRVVERQMPSFDYTGKCKPTAAEPSYEPAFFMALPVERLAVIMDDVGMRHVEAEEKAGLSDLPLVVLDE